MPDAHWVDSLPRDIDFPTRHRHGCLLGALVLLIAVPLVSIALFNAFSRSVGNAMGQGLAIAVRDSGAFAAADVARVAESRGIEAGTLTLGQVQSADTSVRWRRGNVSSTSLDVVSETTAGDHVLTSVAVTPSACIYGLAVGSASDPIVKTDGLPGVGVFRQEGVGQAGCLAEDAPTSGWVRVSAQDLHDAGVSAP
ncbi:MAG TPA: hypothetical protein VLZ77_13635 [Acidimicrobiales bacterium]|nr:hypothetical protein [Acidimicrobiales bacterium]